MCNFVLRPIKSYATVELRDNDSNVIKRGEAFEVSHVQTGQVIGIVNGKQFSVPLETFVHCFTADLNAVSEVKDEEAKWFTPTQKAKK